MDARAAHPWFTVHRRASPLARLLCFGAASSAATRWDPANPEGPTYRPAPMTANSLRV